VRHFTRPVPAESRCLVRNAAAQILSSILESLEYQPFGQSRGSCNGLPTDWSLFLQIATKFASVRNVLFPSQPIRLAAEDKLAVLRRLDKGRRWNFLDDQLYCTICKSVISGRQIEVVGGTNGLRALHLKCSTPGCLSTPADWILPVKSESVREIDILFRDNGA
jgi:hypothetical protein